MTWERSIAALTQAEALARLPSVEGLDTAPASVTQQPGWLADYVSRGRDALRRAYELVQSPRAAGQALGRRIARLVGEGGRAAWRAADSVARRGAGALRELVRTADHLALAWLSTNALIFIAGAIGLLWWLSPKHARTR